MKKYNGKGVFRVLCDQASPGSTDYYHAHGVTLEYVEEGLPRFVFDFVVTAKCESYEMFLQEVRRLVSLIAQIYNSQ